MKKTVSLLLLFFGIVLFVPGQTPEPIDLILVLDTSSSMSGVHREVIDYISGPFLKEFLKTGDTFHLISFSGSPRFEISRRIEGIGDVETILVRMFLLVPLDPYTDVAGALDYTERYVLQLPSSRPKKVVFITDGDQNPEPGTPAAVQDSRTLETRLAEAAARLRLEGTDFYQVTFPLTGSGPSSGRNPAPFRTPPPPSAPKPPQA
ncbi:MAG: VWA domain-containing protein, partial [Treponema sp.]|nr:VWA domain-containing protein [Treponema sp.]